MTDTENENTIVPPIYQGNIDTKDLLETGFFKVSFEDGQTTGTNPFYPFVLSYDNIVLAQYFYPCFDYRANYNICMLKQFIMGSLKQTTVFRTFGRVKFLVKEREFKGGYIYRTEFSNFIDRDRKLNSSKINLYLEAKNAMFSHAKRQYYEKYT